MRIGFPEARQKRRAVVVGLALVASSPFGFGLVARYASGDTPAQAAPATGASSGAAPKSTTVFLRPPPSLASVAIGGSAPDPTALVSKDQWVYDLRYATGDLFLLGIHRVELTAPQATPRAMGRFAFELYEGATLLERVRFDFPMLGDGAGLAVPDAGAALPIQGRTPSFTKVSSRIGVMFPASARGTRVEIVDRATTKRWVLPWPPVEMTWTPEPAGTQTGVTDAGPGDGR